jgi:hypothetical protein
MVSSCVCLVFAAPGGPAKALVDDVVVVADEVEQVSDLGDGQRDQTPGSVWLARWRFGLSRRGVRGQGGSIAHGW